MPVKPLIVPARAFLYSPLGSLASHTFNGALTYTYDRAVARQQVRNECDAANVLVPVFAAETEILGEMLADTYE